jgi:MerR family transcriptional regulator, aldehyde-responsive regulator
LSTGPGAPLAFTPARNDLKILLDLELLQLGSHLECEVRTMKIKEAAERSGLSLDTIRFYEKVGMMPIIARGNDGQRRFSQNNVDWLTVLYWLRKTGMPMKVMHRYATLVHAGDHTIPERKAILIEHGANLEQRREELSRCEELLAYKLAAYDDVERKQTK